MLHASALMKYTIIIIIIHQVNIWVANFPSARRERQTYLMCRCFVRKPKANTASTFLSHLWHTAVGAAEAARMQHYKYAWYCVWNTRELRQRMLRIHWMGAICSKCERELFIDLNKLNLAVKSYLNNVALGMANGPLWNLYAFTLLIFLRPQPRTKRKRCMRRIIRPFYSLANASEWVLCAGYSLAFLLPKPKPKLPHIIIFESYRAWNCKPE